MADFKVGVVTHYFDKIGVAVVDLTDTLSVGDTVRIGETPTQSISSMQIEHEKIDTANKGQSVGLKVDTAVKKGDEIYKVM